MRELRPIDGPVLERAYNEVFREAFPPQELKPLGAIRDMISKGGYRVLALCGGEDELGYICLWEDPPYVLIDYLCVPKGLRGGGIGGEIIAKTIEAYPEGTVFIGETEAPTGDPEADGMILRRLEFYKRCGAVTLPYDTAIFGVHYRTIVWTDCEPEVGEVMRRHEGFYRRSFSPELYDAAVRVPLAEGESAEVTGKWDRWRQ